MNSIYQYPVPTPEVYTKLLQCVPWPCLMLLVRMEEGDGKEGGGSLVSILYEQADVHVTTELNDTFDGAGCRLCVAGGKKFQL